MSRTRGNKRPSSLSFQGDGRRALPYMPPHLPQNARFDTADESATFISKSARRKTTLNAERSGRVHSPRSLGLAPSRSREQVLENAGQGTRSSPLVNGRSDEWRVRSHHFLACHVRHGHAREDPVAISPQVAQARARIAALKRHHPNRPELVENEQRRLKAVGAEEYIVRLLSTSPTLTFDQRARLAALLTNGGQVA